MTRERSLVEKYPPSAQCSCAICISYCRRPGWWTVEEAAAARQAGDGDSMVLEVGPGNAFRFLSPPFSGNEVVFTAKEVAGQDYTFLENERCQLYVTSHQPLECPFCHHDRPGQGTSGYRDVGKQWSSPAERALGVRRTDQSGFWRTRPGGARTLALADYADPPKP